MRPRAHPLVILGIAFLISGVSAQPAAPSLRTNSPTEDGCHIHLIPNEPLLTPTDRCIFTCVIGTPISAHISWQPGAPKFTYPPHEVRITASCGGVETHCQSEPVYYQWYYTHSECESPEAATFATGVGTCVISTPFFGDSEPKLYAASPNAVNWIQGGCRSTAMQVNNVVELVLEDVEEVEGEVRATYSGRFPECRDPPFILNTEPAPSGGRCFIRVMMPPAEQWDLIGNHRTDECIPDGEVGHCIVRMVATATITRYGGPLGWLTCGKGTTSVSGPGAPIAQCIRSGTNMMPGSSIPIGIGDNVPYYHSFKLPPGASCTLRFSQQVDFGLVQVVHGGSVLDYGSNADNPALSAEFVVRNGAGATGPCPPGIPSVV